MRNELQSTVCKESAEKVMGNPSRKHKGLVNINIGMLLIYPYDKRKPLRSLDMFLNKWNP